MLACVLFDVIVRCFLAHLDFLCHILEVGNSPADAPLIFWHLLHA